MTYKEPGLKRRNRALSVLLEMSRFLSSTLELVDLLEGALDKVLSVSGFEAGRIYLKDESSPYLMLAVHKGMEPEGLERVHVNEGFSGKAFRTRSFIARDVLELEDRKRAALLQGKGFRTIVCVPLIFADRAGGVMNLATGKPVRLKPQEIDLLTAMGNQIAVAANNARLYQDLKHQLRVLREKKEMIKFFAYSVSHDLKSPAVGIHGLARRFQEKYYETLDEKGRSYCHQIMRTAEHMVALVEKINAYIAARESVLTMDRVDVAELLDGIRVEFSDVLEKRGIRWIQPEDAPEVRADRTALARIFRNLLDNALKYGGDDLTEIRVDYRTTGDEHVFLFQDNGAGIPSEAREKVFQVFHREAAVCGGIEGSGLGLAIVKEIAERHGGNVSVESRPGAGASFRISLAKDFSGDQSGAATPSSMHHLPGLNRGGSR
ncbi:MAG: HAMP domain-containing histidine kinase [Deltaproteobacteria bacterium]|nr:HAMP domain-containing histidine kinase [Deltaproteobacteria bacterium]